MGWTGRDGDGLDERECSVLALCTFTHPSVADKVGGCVLSVSFCNLYNQLHALVEATKICVI